MPVDEIRRCPDLDCDGPAELDQDGQVQFFSCTRCGFEFGYQQVWDLVQSDGACAVGIPEAVRRRASAAAPSSAPLFQIGRRAT